MRALALLLLAGCATVGKIGTPVEITAKDGARALHIECRRSITNCHQAAQQLCGQYIPLDDNRRTTILSDNFGAYSISVFELTFRCK